MAPVVEIFPCRKLQARPRVPAYTRAPHPKSLPLLEVAPSAGACLGTTMAVPSRDPPNRGINVQALWVAADSAGYASGLWGTYKQWNSTGAQIRKGERATKAIFAGASKAQQAADWMHTRRQETAAA